MATALESLKQTTFTPDAIEGLYRDSKSSRHLKSLMDDANISKAVQALGAGYRSFTKLATLYPHLGYLNEDQRTKFGLTVEGENGLTIIRPLSNTLDIGLTGIQEKIEQAEKTGLFNIIMIASSDKGPFDRKADFSRNFAVVAFVSINGQPLRFGKRPYDTQPPHYIVGNAMGFLIHQSHVPSFDPQQLIG